MALYISACSSEETIAFYKAMGAELADCIIKEIAELKEANEILKDAMSFFVKDRRK